MGYFTSTSLLFNVTLLLSSLILSQTPVQFKQIFFNATNSLPHDQASCWVYLKKKKKRQKDLVNYSCQENYLCLGRKWCIKFGWPILHEFTLDFILFHLAHTSSHLTPFWSLLCFASSWAQPRLGVTAMGLQRDLHSLNAMQRQDQLQPTLSLTD